MIADDRPPLFILSFRQRDELAATAARAGWSAVAARRSDALDRRIRASGATVVVIDARDAVDDGLSAARAVGAALAAQGRSLLVLVSREDAPVLSDFFDAGATQFLASPMHEVEFTEALRFAERHARRVSGGWVKEAATAQPLGWRYDHRHRSFQLSPALAELLGVPPGADAAAVLGRIDRDQRAALHGAIRRALRDGASGLSHDLPDIGRVVEHLQYDPQTTRLHALVEPLGVAPDASVALHDIIPRRSRSVAGLASDLPGGIDRDEIEMFFQPQVDIASGRVVGVEALARWRHPRLGEVGAESLLAAALHGGRAPALSAHLQRRALVEASRWPTALDHLRIAINVTAIDLAADDFVTRMLERVDGSGIARDRLTIELTESDLVENLAAAGKALAAVRAAGCRVAIDDFGTGYSSLAYLTALPLDYLKLDKVLTRAIDSVERDQVIVRGVIAMARSLGFGVIAEGVETPAQRDALASAGCDIYQGYLCAPPLDSARLARMLGA